jgi:hypothetical protein
MGETGSRIPNAAATLYFGCKGMASPGCMHKQAQLRQGVFCASTPAVSDHGPGSPGVGCCAAGFELVEQPSHVHAVCCAKYNLRAMQPWQALCRVRADWETPQGVPARGRRSHCRPPALPRQQNTRTHTRLRQPRAPTLLSAQGVHAATLSYPLQHQLIQGGHWRPPTGEPLPACPIHAHGWQRSLTHTATSKYHATDTTS